MAARARPRAAGVPPGSEMTRPPPTRVSAASGVGPSGRWSLPARASDASPLGSESGGGVMDVGNGVTVARPCSMSATRAASPGETPSWVRRRMTSSRATSLGA